MPESPLFLSLAEITAALEDGLASLGAAGGAIGGGIGGGASAGTLGGAAGAAGGASGGAVGARKGARWFTKLDSRRRHWPQPSTPDLAGRLHQFLKHPQQRELTAPDGSSVVGLYAIIGSGSMNLNPCIIETVWDASGLQAVAYAREGLIKQRTCGKALDRLQTEVFGTGAA
ncbi:hypothetical protein [Ruania albidiflava]|uniref:hypothetical protein n=1 Tax=Ruania albidiflava TaxID=366586 RepID=UPI0023F38F0E|nr:hypothetical protein [Ruania albidiflava]